MIFRSPSSQQGQCCESVAPHLPIPLAFRKFFAVRRGRYFDGSSGQLGRQDGPNTGRLGPTHEWHVDLCKSRGRSDLRRSRGFSFLVATGVPIQPIHRYSNGHYSTHPSDARMRRYPFPANHVSDLVYGDLRAIRPTHRRVGRCDQKHGVAALRLWAVQLLVQECEGFPVAARQAGQVGGVVGRSSALGDAQARVQELHRAPAPCAT